MISADRGSALVGKSVVDKIGNASPALQLLENQIYDLRKEMERLYVQEASFQADIVIEISRRLDLKINEYMHYKLEYMYH